LRGRAAGAGEQNHGNRGRQTGILWQAVTMQTRRVKLFRIGRSQAIRIPRGLELPGDEAVLTKSGERLILEPKPARKRGLLAALARMEPLGEDFGPIEDLPAEPVD
jgi:antitoxin VapB